MGRIVGCRGLFALLLLAVAFFSADRLWATTGTGTLTVSDDGQCSGQGFSNFNSPSEWDVFVDSIIHINIAPSFTICTSGPDNDFGKKCDDADDCSNLNGTCSGTGSCNSNNANCNFLKHCTTGTVGNACSTNSNCNIAGVCSQDATGTCTSGINIGSSCSTAATCSSTGNLCVGTAPNKVCNAGFRAGLSCISNGNCNVTGVCTKPSHCTNSGATNGNSCSANNDCDVAGTCTTDASGTCASGLKSGNTCTSNGDCTYLACSNNSDRNANQACTVDLDCQILKCSQNSARNAGLACTTADECHIVGTCESKLECEVDTCDTSKSRCRISNNACSVDADCRDGDVIIVGTTILPCTADADCDPGTTGDPDTTTCRKACINNICIGTEDVACTQDSDCLTGACNFEHRIDATVGATTAHEIDVCYLTKEMCLDASVAYCDDSNRFANVNFPVSSQTYIPSQLRTVDDTDGESCSTDDDCITAAAPTATCDSGVCNSPITVCADVINTCNNEPGSLCCGLGQGAYGAPNSTATCNTPDCSDAGLGYIPAAVADDCTLSGTIKMFSSDPNATTIGLHDHSPIGSVTLDNLDTLIAYLPTGGAPKRFNYRCPGCVTEDTHYSDPSQIPDANPNESTSKGQGGGTLSGQAMTSAINNFLSRCHPPFGGSDTFTARGFDRFTIAEDGAMVCTRRSGADKVLDTSDDICQAFSYPACVWGKTVAQIQSAADTQLSTGANSLSCTPSELEQALDNSNTQFDRCGVVIECGAVSTPGVFTCPVEP